MCHRCYRLLSYGTHGKTSQTILCIQSRISTAGNNIIISICNQLIVSSVKNDDTIMIKLQNDNDYQYVTIFINNIWHVFFSSHTSQIERLPSDSPHRIKVKNLNKIRTVSHISRVYNMHGVQK